MGFQTQVNAQQAPACAGDFASANPRRSVVAPEGGFIAHANGVTIGAFAWVDTDGKTIKSTGTGKPDGFVHREMQGQIITFLAETGNTIQGGQPVTLMESGDFYAKATVGAATRGQKAFAKLADGTMQAANAGATVAGFIETDFVISKACLVNELAVISK